MRDNAEQLIAKLTNEVATKAPLSLRAVSLRWVAGFALYAIFLVVWFGARADLAVALNDGWFLAEIGLLALIIFSSAYCAVIAAYPDCYQHERLFRLPWIFLIAFFGVLAARWSCCMLVTMPPVHDMECLICISLYALLPGALLMFQMRELASTRPRLASALALLATFALGALVLRLQEATDDIAHVVLWHYLPFFAVALAGVLIGRWALKW